MKIAFIGMGAMGHNIARNILENGFSLTVWNRKDTFWKNAEDLGEKGAVVAETIDDAVKDADVVAFSLTADSAVKSVVEMIKPNLKNGAIVVDHSTTSPGCSIEMSKSLSEKRCYFLDAPVSGGITGADEGTLAVMIGGEEEAFKKVEEVLKAISSGYAYMGGSGCGQSTKLVNQLLTGVNQATVCEAMMIAKAANLDMDKLYNILKDAWGTSRMFVRSVKDYIIPENFESAACLELMQKDLSITQKMANDLGFKVPITDIANHFYTAAKESGIGKEDHSAIIKIMNEENKRR